MADLNDDQKNAYAILNSDNNCFITGEAGTGKSHLIKKYSSEYSGSGELAITATTGVAAVNINGQTIYSWAGVGYCDESVSELVRQIRKKKYALARWCSVGTLLIDELSMITGDMFDKLENIARVLRHSDRPFGGIKIKAFADFGQNSAVAVDMEGFAFEAKCWNNVFGNNVIFLNQIMRQTDPIFTGILSTIRRGAQLSNEQKAVLESCKIEREPPIPGLKPTIINSRNDVIEKLNMSELKKLAIETKNPIVLFTAKKEKTGDIDEYIYKNIFDKISLAEKLYLTIGANVVLIKNLDVENGICNGSRGVLREFITKNNTPVGVIIQFKNGATMPIYAEPYEAFNNGGSKITITQLPILLCWGLTGHRAQGLTLDFIKIGLDNCFAHGLFYSIISRCKSLDGLFIDSIDYNKIIVDDRVKKFYSW
jgi:ATP-dependent DNA helicase PIF1